MFYWKSIKLFLITRSWICNILDSELHICSILFSFFLMYIFFKIHGIFLICFAFDFVPDGRTDPILDDVSEAFQLMGVSLHELEDYIHNIEPVTFPHQIPSFPVSKNNVLQFPQPGSKDAEERKEYIPDYMPPIVSSQEGLWSFVCFLLMCTHITSFLTELCKMLCYHRNSARIF